MKNTEEVSAAEMVASLIEGTGTSFMTSVSKPVAYRIPVHVCAAVDAMAARSGKSRNAMLNLLVSVGVDTVRGALTEPALEALLLAEAHATAVLMKDGLSNESISE